MAILSLSRGGAIRKADALATVRSSPGFEDLWQTELITNGPEKEHNSTHDLIANLNDGGDHALFIKVSAGPDGSFTLTNARNGYTKEYAPRK